MSLPSPASSRSVVASRSSAAARVTTAIFLSLAAFAAVLAMRASAQTASAGLEAAIARQLDRVAEDPGNASAYNDLGNLLALAGSTEEARDAYGRALGIDPDHQSAHYNLGLLLLEHGPLNEALEHFEKSIALDPLSAWSHFQRGEVLRRRGSSDAAERAYIRSFEIDPNLASPTNNPQVIGNPLTATALLKARADRIPNQVERLYEEPQRIAALFFEDTESLLGDSTEPSDADAGSAEAQGSTRVQQPPPVTAPSAVPSPGPEQAPAARTPTATNERPAAATGAPTPAPERQRKTRTLGVQDLRGGSAAGQAPTNPTAAPPRSRDSGGVSRFRPGRRSSARLEFRVGEVDASLARPADD